MKIIGDDVVDGSIALDVVEIPSLKLLTYLIKKNSLDFTTVMHERTEDLASLDVRLVFA